MTISELSKFQQLTILKNGCIYFNTQQSIDDSKKIIITEGFTSEEAYKKHLSSTYLQDFLKLDLMKLDNGFATRKIF